MKLSAKLAPYSSIVGNGVSLFDETGRARFLVMFTGTTDGITQVEDAALAQAFVDFVSECGLEVPDREGQ